MRVVAQQHAAARVRPGIETDSHRPTTTSCQVRCTSCSPRIRASASTATTTHQTVLSGAGDTHLAVALERLARKFGVNVSRPKMCVCRTARPWSVSAEAEGKVKKQSGGHGQYAVANLRVSPLERGAGIRVRRLDRRRRDPPQLHPGGAEGHRGDDGTPAARTASPSSTSASSATTASTTPSTRPTWRSRTLRPAGSKRRSAAAGAVVLEPISLLKVTSRPATRATCWATSRTRRGRVGRHFGGRARRAGGVGARAHRGDHSLRASTCVR